MSASAMAERPVVGQRDDVHANDERGGNRILFDSIFDGDAIFNRITAIRGIHNAPDRPY